MTAPSQWEDGIFWTRQRFCIHRMPVFICHTCGHCFAHTLFLLLAQELSSVKARIRRPCGSQYRALRQVLVRCARLYRAASAYSFPGGHGGRHALASSECCLYSMLWPGRSWHMVPSLISMACAITSQLPGGQDCHMWSSVSLPTLPFGRASRPRH
jgi:hypothetical protein